MALSICRHVYLTIHRRIYCAIYIYIYIYICLWCMKLCHEIENVFGFYKMSPWHAGIWWDYSWLVAKILKCLGWHTMAVYDTAFNGQNSRNVVCLAWESDSVILATLYKSKMLQSRCAAEILIRGQTFWARTRPLLENVRHLIWVFRQYTRTL